MNDSQALALEQQVDEVIAAFLEAERAVKRQTSPAPLVRLSPTVAGS